MELGTEKYRETPTDQSNLAFSGGDRPRLPVGAECLRWLPVVPVQMLGRL